MKPEIGGSFKRAGRCSRPCTNRLKNWLSSCMKIATKRNFLMRQFSDKFYSEL